jgi:hypothetical protein
VPPLEVDASHEAFEATVQVQAGSLAVTVTLPVPAPALADALVVESV